MLIFFDINDMYYFTFTIIILNLGYQPYKLLEGFLKPQWFAYFFK